jgi:two-component system sensor kinase FixL
MGHLAAGFAHELNQPLGAAANFIGAAQITLPPANDGALKQYGTLTAKAAEQILRAGSILRRLRDFVTGREAESEIVVAKDLVVDAVALAVIGVKDPNLRIRYDFDPPQLAVVVDRIQIQQVVFNLVRNALEATDGRPAREIVLSGRRFGREQVLVTVADNGPGLSDDPEKLNGHRPIDLLGDRGSA